LATPAPTSQPTSPVHVFLLRRGILLIGNTSTDNISADVSSTDGHSNNLQAKFHSTNNVSADVSSADVRSNNLQANFRTIYGKANIGKANSGADFSPTNDTTNILAVGDTSGFAISGTNGSTIGSSNSITISISGQDHRQPQR
jgi:hypothetical protein